LGRKRSYSQELFLPPRIYNCRGSHISPYHPNGYPNCLGAYHQNSKLNISMIPRMPQNMPLHPMISHHVPIKQLSGVGWKKVTLSVWPLLSCKKKPMFDGWNPMDQVISSNYNVCCTMAKNNRLPFPQGIQPDMQIPMCQFLSEIETFDDIPLIPPSYPHTN